MDHDANRANVIERTARIRRDSTHTDAELITRQLDTVDLIVGGATVRQVAAHYGLDMHTVRDDYHAGLNLLTDRSIDRSIALREEITLRQRALILANMPRAKAGDRISAQIVQNSDALLISLWGLRSLRADPPARRTTSELAEAVEAYLDGVTAGSLPPAR